MTKWLIKAGQAIGICYTIFSMKKIFFLIVLTGVAAAFLNAMAYWPFEKQWENNPTEKEIILNDNGYKFALISHSQKVGDFLAEQKISLAGDDYLFPPKENDLTTGMEITIKRALPVTITADGKEIELKTFSKTVEAALSEAGLTLSHLDKVEPEKDTTLERDMKIKVTRINVEEVTQEEVIEFEVIEKDDPKLKWRKQRVDQEGENGTKDVIYKITYTNGKQTSKVKLSATVTKKPVSKIVANGTKIEVGKVTRGGGTWYSYTGTLACASLQFPKGTWLRVTNTATGKQVIVQVNDSGPYGEGRIIDLDKVAFQKIASIGQGVINVKVEEILQ